MGSDAEHFRARARECRDLAARTKPGYVRTTLLKIALELAQEASMIDANLPSAAEGPLDDKLTTQPGRPTNRSGS